ncbi:choice-of-anchor I family protein [Cohnella zeiphila]|uniref:Choice-of-anchor I family protein n=1 Tax=Cohnella zeiphila TaxID=2761120 RepID=A0A7X0SXA3_9BACL|nr:choice-of-anchor I family protein [Cohnella zeiphila]MBB6735618.1 choice-of-anchor I family protein [Cohnella zeiphila]
MSTGFSRSKKLISLVLSAEVALSGLAVALPAASAADEATPGAPYKADGTYDVTVPHVIINQVYGDGGKTGAAGSNGFIELYNPTDANVDLSGWSLQYADPDTEEDAESDPSSNAWHKLDLQNEIKPHSSYLVVGASAEQPDTTLDLTGKGDQTWDQVINNKELKVVLMSNQDQLSNAMANPFADKPPGYVDMLGTAGEDGDPIDGYESNYPFGAGMANTKNVALRRMNFADTDDNKANFEPVSYKEYVPTGTSADPAPRNSASGEWGVELAISTSSLPDAQVGKDYAAAIAATGGKAPYTFAATGLPEGLTLDAATGAITGVPADGAEGAATVELTVTDSEQATVNATLTLNVAAAETAIEPVADQISIAKIGGYSVGTTNADGGVAEIVKYNPDNKEFYLVNGSANPPTLDIVSLTGGDQVAPAKTTSVPVADLAERKEGFVYGDLTSVDINTRTKRVALAVQEADSMKNGQILVLDYDGNLIKSYEAGVQPDMVKFTSDGRYILTADEAEPRTAAGDPEGSVTVVDTQTGSDVHVKFDKPDVIDDNVHVRGRSDANSPQITSAGSKEDAVFDFEPEYITLSADEKTAYVSLQENNAIARIDVASHSLLSVKGLGLKDLNDPRNELDLLKDGKIHFENVPFYGVYMPDGIDSYTVDGKSYVLTANEGDETEWPATDGDPIRVNTTKVKSLKGSLDPNSAAAQFLNGTTAYDGVTAMSDMGNEGIYLYGGRSFSIWDADTMAQVYDSGSDFEKITATRLPDSFNASNDDADLDSRSSKKGPEPEYVKVGQVGNRTLAFVGLERVGGVMTYDITDPHNVYFVNYTNTRDFTKGLETDSGPEGLDFIPAAISPTGRPLLLVANEVGGTVAVLQVNVAKVTLDRSSLSLLTNASPVQLKATADPASGITWTSSNPLVAGVDENGNVKPLSAGTTVIRAASADGYGAAECVVSVSYPAVVTNPGSTPNGSGDSSNAGKPSVTDGAKGAVATTVVSAKTDENGKATLAVTPEQVADALEALRQSASGKSGGTLELKASVEGNATSAAFKLPAEAWSQISANDGLSVRFDAGLAAVTLDPKALAAISSVAGDSDVSITVSLADKASLPNTLAPEAAAAIGDRPVYVFAVDAGSEHVGNFSGGKADVSVPYKPGAGEGSDAVILYFVAADGSAQVVPNANYDASTGLLSFRTGHFSTYAVGYNPVTFTDTESSFAKRDIALLAARGIVGGAGDGTFSPKAKLTRGDFALLLARLAGADLSGVQGSPFADVPVSAYYAKAVQWAASGGVVNGVGEQRFDPQAIVTREQMAVMIARLAKLSGVDLPATASAGFADQADIPAYAADAVSELHAAGLLTGKSAPGGTGFRFAPKDETTREEAAKVLAAMLKLL